MSETDRHKNDLLSIDGNFFLLLINLDVLQLYFKIYLVGQRSQPH